MNDETEKQKALSSGLIACVPIAANSEKLLVCGRPLPVACRIISEGQYQALLEVWKAAVKIVKYEFGGQP